MSCWRFPPGQYCMTSTWKSFFAHFHGARNACQVLSSFFISIELKHKVQINKNQCAVLMLVSSNLSLHTTVCGYTIYFDQRDSKQIGWCKFRCIKLLKNRLVTVYKVSLSYNPGICFCANMVKHTQIESTTNAVYPEFHQGWACGQVLLRLKCVLQRDLRTFTTKKRGFHGGICRLSVPNASKIFKINNGIAVMASIIRNSKASWCPWYS